MCIRMCVHSQHSRVDDVGCQRMRQGEFSLSLSLLILCTTDAVDVGCCVFYSITRHTHTHAHTYTGRSDGIQRMS